MRTLFGLQLLLLALLLSGCSRASNKPKDSGTKDSVAKDAPPAKAEAGWLFASEGDEHYHMRLHVEAGEKKATAKILDENEKEAVLIDAETITLVLKEGKGEKVPLKALAEKGKKASVFVGQHDRFADKIDPKKVEVHATMGKQNLIFQLEGDEHPPKK